MEEPFSSPHPTKLIFVFLLTQPDSLSITLSIDNPRWGRSVREMVHVPKLWAEPASSTEPLGSDLMLQALWLPWGGAWKGGAIGHMMERELPLFPV